MKRIIYTIATVSLFLTGLNAYSQSEAEMKAYMDFMTPGDPHKMMAKWDGTWEEDVTHWMQPGAAPNKTKLVSESKMIFGGLYQESKITGEFFGMKFEAIMTMGYDNARKMFVSTWIDNMGSGIIKMEGPWDAATKTITLIGAGTDPVSGKDLMMRQTIKIVDDNTQQIEMYSTMNGKEFKSMEIKSTKKK